MGKCEKCAYYRPVPGALNEKRKGCHYNYLLNGEVNVKDIAEGIESVSIYCRHYLPVEYEALTMSQYQALAGRTMDRRLPRDVQTRHGVYGLMSECGEVASLYQHAIQEGGGIDPEKLMGELGDVLWFLAEIAEGNGMNLAEIAGANITKLAIRYPNGFDGKRSAQRHGFGEDK